MKKIILCSIITLFTCSVFKTKAQQSKINKLTFTVENVYEQSPESSKQMGSFLSQVDSTQITDSILHMYEVMMQKKLERTLKYPNEIYIESVENGWQRQRYTENRYTDYLRYHPENDSIELINYQSNRFEIGAKLIRDSCTYEIERDTSKKKVIWGYNCYFVKLKEFCCHQEAIDILGSTVYDMWVTTEINIPSYLILKNNCLIEEQFFPLETKKYQSKSENSYHLYTIKSIE